MKNKKRGLYLIDSLSSGGAQRQFVELLKGLDRSWIEPIAVTYHDLGFFYDAIQAEGIRHVLIPKTGKFGLGVMRGLFGLARSFKPHFIHSYLNTPNFYARMLKLFGSVTSVITSERNVSITASPSLSAIEKACWRLSDRIIVNAIAIKDVLTNRIGIDPRRISVVYNGVSTQDFSGFDRKHVEKIRSQMGLPDHSGILIGLIGRLAEQKNHRLLVEAVAQVKQRLPKELIKVGFWGQNAQAGYREKLEKDIKRLKLSHDVRFFDAQKDMASVYAACDIIALPSLWEGFPNVVMEGMAAGRVVVASDISDNALLVNNSSTGFLFESNSVYSMQNALCQAIQMEPDTRITIGIQAREYIAQHFPNEKMARHTMAVYREIGLG